MFGWLSGIVGLVRVVGSGRVDAFEGSLRGGLRRGRDVRGASRLPAGGGPGTAERASCASRRDAYRSPVLASNFFIFSWIPHDRCRLRYAIGKSAARSAPCAATLRRSETMSIAYFVPCSGVCTNSGANGANPPIPRARPANPGIRGATCACISLPLRVGIRRRRRRRALAAGARLHCTEVARERTLVARAMAPGAPENCGKAQIRQELPPTQAQMSTSARWH